MYNIGDEIVPEFTTETFNEWEVVLVAPEDSTVVTMLSNGHLRAIGGGKETVKMHLKNYDVDDPRRAVVKEFEITINASTSEEALFIKGEDSIKLDRYAQYTLFNEDTSNAAIMSENDEPLEFIAVNNDEKEKVPLVTVKPAYDNDNNLIK